MTFLWVLLIATGAAVVWFWFADVRKNYLVEQARMDRENQLMCQYNIIVYLLIETGYGVEYENMSDGTKVIVREDGSMIKINPFGVENYQREQLARMADWFEEKEPQLWQATDTDHNKQATGRSEMSMRVRACLDEYCKDWD